MLRIFIRNHIIRTNKEYEKKTLNEKCVFIFMMKSPLDSDPFAI